MALLANLTNWGKLHQANTHLLLNQLDISEFHERYYSLNKQSGYYSLNKQSDIPRVQDR